VRLVPLLDVSVAHPSHDAKLASQPIQDFSKKRRSDMEGRAGLELLNQCDHVRRRALTTPNRTDEKSDRSMRPDAEQFRGKTCRRIV
jgi:hypothetical protein